MTEQSQTQLLQRAEDQQDTPVVECEFWYRQSASETVLQIALPIGYNTSNKSVTGTVDAVSGNSISFKTDKTSGTGHVVAAYRDEYTEANLGEDVNWNSLLDFVQPFDSCSFPADGALGDFASKSYVVRKVDKIDYPGDESNYFQDSVILYDAFGDNLAPPAALVGKTVTFSDLTRVHPEEYDLYYVVQTAGATEGDHVLIPRPNGTATDQYTLDPITGIIVLLDPWFTARPTYSQYCFVLKYTRFDRVNEVKKTDIQEMRTMAENLQTARYYLTTSNQGITASRSLYNHWNQKPLGNQIVRDIPNDWNYLSDPIVTGTYVTGDYGVEVRTAASGLPEDDWLDRFGVSVSAKFPILTMTDKRFLSTPGDWEVLSATLRLKVTRLTGTNSYEFPEFNVVTDPNYSPPISVGRVFKPDPTKNYCANLQWNTDDPDAPPRCVLRDNMNIFRRGDDNDFSGVFGNPSKCENCEVIGPGPAQIIFHDFPNSTGGWVHNCNAGSPTATSYIMGARGPGLFYWDGVVWQRRTQTLTQSEFFRDEAEEKTGDVEPFEGNGISCIYAQFFEWSMPDSNSSDSISADGSWSTLDVTDIIQEIHAEANSTPGEVGLTVGSPEMINWNADDLESNDILLADIMINDRSGDPGAPSGGWNVKSFIPSVREFTFELEVGELLVTWKAPDGFKAPLVSHTHLPGLTK